MSKYAILTVVAVFMILVSACNQVFTYAVINSSDSELVVEFVIKAQVNSLEHTANKPYKTSISDWNSWLPSRTDWHAVPISEYEFIPEARMARIVLKRDEVLRLDLENEFYFRDGGFDEFQIESIRLIGAHGTVVYEGKDLSRQFEKKNASNYFLEYR